MHRHLEYENFPLGKKQKLSAAEKRKVRKGRDTRRFNSKQVEEIKKVLRAVVDKVLSPRDYVGQRQSHMGNAPIDFSEPGGYENALAAIRTMEFSCMALKQERDEYSRSQLSNLRDQIGVLKLGCGLHPRNRFD